MYIKLIAIILFSFLYGFFELLLGIRQKNKLQVVKSGDKRSTWILIISIGYYLSFLVGSTKIGRIYHWDAFFVIGAIMITIGLIIRISAILTLKKQFTYTVTKLVDHELIETGMYKLIRHPAYLGQLIIFTGLAVTLSNWLSIIIMLVSVLSGYLYRINIEEKFMAEQIGQNYINYKKRTKRLIPGIY